MVVLPDLLAAARRDPPDGPPPCTRIRVCSADACALKRTAQPIAGYRITDAMPRCRGQNACWIAATIRA